MTAGTWPAGSGVDDATAARWSLARVEDAVVRARAALVGAADVRWVSVAAEAYRREVEVHVRALDALGRSLDAARDAVLAHLAAAARAEHAALGERGR